jgi:hypothetical protein
MFMLQRRKFLVSLCVFRAPLQEKSNAVKYLNSGVASSRFQVTGLGIADPIVLTKQLKVER